jgi:hypothetical protein
MTSFEKLVGKALLDEKFRKRLQKSPHTALKEIGVAGTSEKISALKDCNDALTKLRKLFGGQKEFY